MRIFYTKLYTALMTMSVTLISCSDLNHKKKQSHTDANGYTYETVVDDTSGLRLYTLDNGLTVYLSKNEDEPKIQTYIAVRAGSNYDPNESTGLAHYLEHMLFKGTSKIGTLDWDSEKKKIAEISDLYEAHKQTTDPSEKNKIYKEIDSVSLKASQFSVANEYDKLLSSIGATGTNAHTWFEETIYKNKIPSTELKKWLHVESERFGELVLRLFHTELEAVFEEFNMGQDNDYRKVYAAMLEGLFPNHPYGQKTTIGTAAHLKNPSMVAIQNYFNTYYVPNNMAVVLVGDFDFETTIQEIDASFGKLKSKPVSHPKLPVENPIDSIIVKEVYGPTAESVSISYRTKAIGSHESKIITLINKLLSNSTAGLIDLNLNQSQAVQYAYADAMFLNDYGYHEFSGNPKAGQSLEEVRDLLLSQIELIKNGTFEDWMLTAVINEMKLNQIKTQENATDLAAEYYNAFIHRQDWSTKVSFIEDLQKISKEEIVLFAKEFYKDNYVIVYKRQGVDDKIVKVKNPGISPVNLNRGKQSKFVTDFIKMPSEDLQPVFVDYKTAMQEFELSNGLPLTYVANKDNDLFSLNIVFDMGKDHSKDLELAVQYLEFLGTKDLTAQDLKKEFYKLGIRYNVTTKDDKSFLTLSGLNENFAAGLDLLYNVLDNVVVDQLAYRKLVQKIMKERYNNRSQKRNILWDGLFNYAKYGASSRLRDIYSFDDFKTKNPEELVTILRGLKDFKHRIFFYGKDVKDKITYIESQYESEISFKEIPSPTKYKALETGGEILYVDFDMVQAELIFVSKQDVFDPKNKALSTVFNSYFGSGLSSIVFQEIRESKSLAYSAFSVYKEGSKIGENDYVYAYIGTQANKLPAAVKAMLDLMDNMPLANKQFEAAKKSVLKKIASQRVNKTSLFWAYENLIQKGLPLDFGQKMYDEIQKMTLEDLQVFFNDNIKGGKYNIVLLGNKKDVDMKALSRLGTVKEMEIDQLFNY
ncbi:MAG: M16 family metallopeptidase [Flavicella sp.]